MRRPWLVLLVPLWLGATCVQTELPPDPAADIADVGAVDYLSDVAPILDRRCVACHSCYNAPCQLKLGSFEGVDRGATKAPVYDTSRLTPQPPTRLFFDAHTTAQWRDKGFFSVTEGRDGGDSSMLYLLDAKRRQPIPDGVYHAEEDLTCPSDTGEVARFLAEHPDRGMPFGFPGLADGELATLASWLRSGARGPDAVHQRALDAPGAAAAAAIARWESFLNRSDAKHAMTARYLYEHFFLAHLHFSGSGGREFYRLVRSTTPPGEAVEVIATRRPYDDPGVPAFYYRFDKIHSTIVYKTHMLVEFDDATLARYRQLFIEPEWLEPPHVVALDDTGGANPFLVYAQIPPESRYRFMLDHSEYILRTFIRGPVCKGQVALNVIHDHFWVMFLDPSAEQTLQHPEFLVAQAANLRLPTEAGSDEHLVETFSNRYRKRYARFYRAKSDLYEKYDLEGFGIGAIWPGRRAVDAPLLTVYRHFDSASVHRGPLGNLPRTLWVIDYPQFERIYYALVAGFDVFGNISHQVNVRRYMDYLRIEGELNFLEFMPPDRRVEMLQSWYIGDRAVENVDHDAVRSRRGTRVVYRTSDPKRELVERVVDERLLRAADIAFDPIGFRRDGGEAPMPRAFHTREDIFDGFRALTAPGTGFIRHVTSSEANLVYVRVRDPEADDHVFTIVVNRWHDNVNSMFGEADTLDPAKDDLDFVSGFVGSYPNYFLVVDVSELPDFFDLLANFDGSDAYVARWRRYGINRSDPDFWSHYDWFQARMDQADPLEAGVMDLNRYYSVALGAEATPVTAAAPGADR